VNLNAVEAAALISDLRNTAAGARQQGAFRTAGTITAGADMLEALVAFVTPPAEESPQREAPPEP